MLPLIFTDLDGSLIDHRSYQLCDAKPLFDWLLSNQHPVIPNTSKTFAETSVFCQTHGFSGPFICENGAVAYIPENYFSTPPADTRLKNGYWVKGFVQPKQHWFDSFCKLSKPYQHVSRGFTEMTVQELCQLTGLSTEDGHRAKYREFGEPVHWFGNDQQKQQYIQSLKQSGFYVVEGGRFLHVGKGGSKGEAMLWMQGEYQQQSNRFAWPCIALGDGDNDVSMLQQADYAIVIRSSYHKLPKVKHQHFLYTTQSTGPKGWSEGMEYLLNTHFGVQLDG